MSEIYVEDDLKVAWILGADVSGFACIYMVFNTYCYWKLARGDNCCGSDKCIKANHILYHSFMLALAITILVIAAINFG